MPKTVNPDTKTLKINDVVFAYYEIVNKKLFLKVMVLISEDEILSEKICIELISTIENLKFSVVSYLNINH